MNEEIKTLATIIRHQKQVAYLLRELARKLEQRADIHDLSKLELDELEGFYQLDLNRNYQKEEYNSPGYDKGLQINAVRLHLSRNPHHPEYWPNGLSDMSFIDIIEMLCDWEIARQTRDIEQDINKTWESRQKRFDLSSDELKFLKGLWKKISEII